MGLARRPRRKGCEAEEAPAWFEDEGHLEGIVNPIVAKAWPVKMTLQLGLFVFPAPSIEIPIPARIEMARVIETLAGG